MKLFKILIILFTTFAFMYLFGFDGLNYFFEHRINECGGGPSKISSEKDPFADHMVNRSPVGKNFGDEFKEKFAPYEEDYYRSPLKNSEELERIMDRLDSPKNSPTTKSINLIESAIDFDKKDIDKTNAKNLEN